ncbi:MAG TPA: ATP-binding SpoIIE family protein phosphatase [Stellaceae bacterium]|nr:ATP-binding SpoIIE family protein phosphatase [Stellaceae bacterium]
MLIAISDQSQIAAARRSAEAIARELGFDELRVGRVALIATEMASNVLKHASHGHLMLTRFADSTGRGLEVLAADKGPGIRDVARSLEDGYSTVGTPGTGLGAIRRQADIFDIYSRPGAGTVVMARILAEDGTAGVAGDCEIGIVLLPYPGELECGDSWAFGLKSGVPSLFAVDGSGHGPHAASAARSAVEAFEKSDQMDSVRVMETIHRALAPTRGAAVAVARVDRPAQLVRFSGIGNIAAALVSEGVVKRMVSLNGTAGHVAPRVREFTYPYSGAATVILHSDGVSAKWDLASYPGLAACRPSIIAGLISRDFRRTNDDSLVAVLRVAA